MTVSYIACLLFSLHLMAGTANAVRGTSPRNMTVKVFWPTSGITQNEGTIVGWLLRDTLVVIGIIDKWLTEKYDYDESTSVSLRLQNLGYAQPVDTSEQAKIDEGSFWLNSSYLPVRSSQMIELVLYTPPDHHRLRFLRSSSGSQPKSNISLAIQDGYTSSTQRSRHLDGIENVIDLINKSKSAQKGLHSVSCHLGQPKDITVKKTASNQSSRIVVSSLAVLLVPLECSAQALVNLLAYPTPIDSLRSYSSTFDQVHLRLSQLLEGPERFKSTREVTGIEIRSERYIRFWNTVWLVFNDLILGYTARQLILLYAPYARNDVVPIITRHSIDLPILALKWLNDWPVGLKLNTPLSQFFCTGLGWMIEKWGDLLIPFLRSFLPTFIQIFALVSLGGFTLTLSLLDDTLSILTSHFYLCHVLMKYIFNWQLQSLSGLWNLFRGKRWNVLRKRTDSYDYDVDQLFLGTLLFTVSAFLFPTVLTYFALFAMSRIVILGLHKMISTGTTALNAFPLFELMLRLKEPSRLPSGVCFKIRRLQDVRTEGGLEGNVRIAYAMEIKNSPKSLAEIMFPSA
ncbi:uncharacterized protein IL334_002752 [Kwoniella shivajii]|uniref:Phosphatidylinositol glycan, class Q n=1 Tax=Kwoniella shivajii TaxID=564305 RepID=A0ABZ1CW81_9TREE|nr:hypothetical protein IL334_002752 [Kwoniella shivajii]